SPYRRAPRAAAGARRHRMCWPRWAMGQPRPVGSCVSAAVGKPRRRTGTLWRADWKRFFKQCRNLLSQLHGKPTPAIASSESSRRLRIKSGVATLGYFGNIGSVAPVNPMGLNRPNQKERKYFMITRRQAIKQAALGTMAAASALNFVQAQPAPAAAPAGPFKLPPLPFAFDALEPHIDARTMEIHHDKHHAAYVSNLNKAVADKPDLAKKSVDELLRDLNKLPANIQTAVRNQGGGHYNHTLFWQMLKKSEGGKPSGELAKAIDAKFNSFDGFKDAFSKAATSLFGSGWVWLVKGD